MQHKVQKISETTKYFRNFFSFFATSHRACPPVRCRKNVGNRKL